MITKQVASLSVVENGKRQSERVRVSKENELNKPWSSGQNKSIVQRPAVAVHLRVLTLRATLIVTDTDRHVLGKSKL